MTNPPATTDKSVVCLFHQNMRHFGGGTPARNAAYQVAFGAAAAVSGPVAIAGLTELTNNGPAMQLALGPIFGALGPGIAPQAIVNSRRTVANAIDYTAIGTAPVPILSFGRIVLQVWNQGTALHNDIAPPQGNPGFAAWCANLPPVATIDYQHLPYVVATIAGTQVGVGFLHNIYSVNDARSLILQRLPDAADLIMANPAMAGSQVVYVCGDFNAIPWVRQNAHTIMTPYSQGTTAPPGPAVNPQAALLPPQVANGGVVGGTTMAASLYDYSFSSIQPGVPPPPGLIPPLARIDVRTMEFWPGGQAIPGMGAAMSDHTASFLQVS
jgi:hypothetical protein